MTERAERVSSWFRGLFQDTLRFPSRCPAKKGRFALIPRSRNVISKPTQPEDLLSQASQSGVEIVGELKRYRHVYRKPPLTAGGATAR
jgi:hypothetical protein